MNEEEKAIKILQEFKKTGFHTLSLKYDTDRIHTNKLIENSIDTVLNLIDKQNKVIDEMAKRLEDEELYVNVNGICLYGEDCHEDCKDCIKQYFIRKVEENGKNSNRK